MHATELLQHKDLALAVTVRESSPKNAMRTQLAAGTDRKTA